MAQMQRDDPSWGGYLHPDDTDFSESVLPRWSAVWCNVYETHETEILKAMARDEFDRWHDFTDASTHVADKGLYNLASEQGLLDSEGGMAIVAYMRLRADVPRSDGWN